MPQLSTKFVLISQIFLLTFLHYTSGERRVVGGDVVKALKRYMVYLVQLDPSIRNYDSWICGGAIVSPLLILTSAACVKDVQKMYAIAGYQNYVKWSQLDSDRCTKAWKRKVVNTYVPVAYKLQYDKVEVWSNIDISIVKIDKPLQYGARDWKDCTYTPAVIPINFDPKYQEPGTNAIVLGWGHKSIWRSPNVKTQYNQDRLHYASVSILATKECKRFFKKPDLGKQIDDYMICTLYGRKLDESGKVIASRNPSKAKVHNNNKALRSKGHYFIDGHELSDFYQYQQYLYGNYRRKGYIKAGGKGFCQNDHGGPLVTWVNGVEHVIGVASVFRIDRDSNCVGPFLYTSTEKSKEFIKCILAELNKSGDTIKSSMCRKKVGETRFEVIRSYLNWTDDNIDSPRENLTIRFRPQIPMSHYRGR